MFVYTLTVISFALVYFYLSYTVSKHLLRYYLFFFPNVYFHLFLFLIFFLTCLLLHMDLLFLTSTLSPSASTYIYVPVYFYLLDFTLLIIFT